MTIEFLTKASKIIEAGLRKTPPTEAPHPMRPEPEPDRCVWCCPATCLNCGIENCEDRLAGGGNEIS